MAEHEQEVFLPEEVDEQIGEYLAPSPLNKQSLDTSAQNTVQALQRHFAPAEQDAALQRVWQRFEQRRTTMHKHERAQPRVTAQQERRYRMKQRAHSSRPARGGLRAHRLSQVAALMFVTLLVGSMVVLFRLASNGRSVVSGRPMEKKMFALVNRTLYRLYTNTHQALWHFQVPAGADGRPGIIPSRGQVVNDTYYLSGMSGNQVKLYALDVASGKVRWRVDFSGSVQVSGTTVYISLIKDGYPTVEALDSASGAEKWEHHLGNKIVESQGALPFNEPYVALIAASDKAVYGELIPPKNGKNSELRFALSAQDGTPLWQKNEEIANLIGIDQGFVVDGVLCVAKRSYNIQPQIVQQGFLLGYDAASGEQLWSKQLDGPPSLFGTTVLNSVIYLSTIRTGQGQGNSVYAFSAKDGALIWRYQDSGSSYPMVTEHGVYINRDAGQTLVALDTASGKVRWTYTFHDALTVEYPPAADNDQVYLSLPDNVIQILRASDGKPIGSFKAPGTVDPNNRVLLQVVG
jgi:outer membrane protein assembly factor BamB